MNGHVPVPREVDASKKAPLLRTYVLAKIRNELELDWQSVACAEPRARGTAKANATMRIQPLVGPPRRRPEDEEVARASARASSRSRSRTATIDGLLVDFWDAKERSATP